MDKEDKRNPIKDLDQHKVIIWLSLILYVTIEYLQ